MKNQIKYFLIIATLFFLLLSSSGCDITSPDDPVKPAYLKINLLFESSESYKFQTQYFDSIYIPSVKITNGVIIRDSVLLRDTTLVTDFLNLVAGSFKLFDGEKFADVFQNPNQFFEQNFLYKRFNAFASVYYQKSIQVAYGAIAPYTERRKVEYDSLLFSLRPISDVVKLNGLFLPIRSKGIDEDSGKEISTVVKIREKFKFEEGKTYTLNLKFKLQNILYRVYDEFLFNPVYDSYELIKE